MPFTGSTFAHLFDWALDPQRQEKIINARLEAEFDGIDTGLSSRLARAGTTTNDDAAAGDIGEYISSTVASASAVALTTSTAANVTSISLTAGDWDVSTQGYYTVSVSASDIRVGISTTSATFPSFAAGAGSQSIISGPNFSTTALGNGPFRISLSGTTTVFMVVFATFGAGTVSAHGTIRARRVR